MEGANLEKRESSYIDYLINIDNMSTLFYLEYRLGTEIWSFEAGSSASLVQQVWNLDSALKREMWAKAESLRSKEAQVFHIAVLPGDGIGPEITREAVKVLKAVGRKYRLELVFSHHLVGARQSMRRAWRCPMNL